VDDLHTTVASGLAERYTTLAEKVRELAAPLSDEQFWRKPFPFGNSFGHLVLHLTGNLNYYIGAQIAGTGYVRDRDGEFAETKRPPKREVLRRSVLSGGPSASSQPITGQRNTWPCARRMQETVSTSFCDVLRTFIIMWDR
jgi:hypothetical protein